MTSEVISLQRRPSHAAAEHAIGEQKRFTINGSDALEEWLGRMCCRVSAEVARIVPQSRLDAILLAGGYGRGEGGVLKTVDGDRPYNDMEFYVFVRGNHLVNEQRFGRSLHEVGHRLSRNVEVEIELKLVSFAKLRASAPSMFYYDLVMGHRWVAGHEALLRGTQHHRVGADIPLHEATRLLMNRGSGLLFARELLDRKEWGAESADFVARNISKAQLALGDAVLTACGRYHWSCRERNRRLHDLISDAPDLNAIRCYHDEAVSFKLNPVRTTDPRELLRYRHDEVSSHACAIFLWLESKRLERRFANASAYAMDDANKCPETNPLRNTLINLRFFGVATAGLTMTRHPRERVLNAMALLLWTRGLYEPALTKRTREMLNADVSTFAEAVDAYRRVWRRVN